MKVTITPSRAEGSVSAPPSKSMAHRALICGALSGGSIIRNLAWSKDIEATLSCLSAMGASVERLGDTVRIGGLDPFKIPSNTSFYCNESGSTLRFLLPLCLLCNHPVTLGGSSRLMKRPLSVYEDICREQNLPFSHDTETIRVCGRLAAGKYRIPGDVSSQFVSGLLFTLPLLAGDSELEVVGRFESSSYIDLTLSALHAFGIRIDRTGNAFYIYGNQQYAAADYTVEGDCSNAAFLEAFNLIGGAVKVDGLTAETLQGDRVYREYYCQMQQGEKNFDLQDCPDLAPILFAMAAVHGGAEFSNTARLRIKESDRASAMAQELAKFGISVTVNENTVLVHKGCLQAPCEPLYGHNDHRIVMSLSVLCSITGGTIEDAQAVAKSYPDFFDVLKSLQIGLTIHET